VCCRSGGVISHIGLQDGADGLDTRRLTLAEIIFAGNYTYTPGDLSVALDLLARGALGSLAWVETRPLDKGAESFDSLASGDANAAKIVLLPPT
jgi:alcohol dehydrogenase